MANSDELTRKVGRGSYRDPEKTQLILDTTIELYLEAGYIGTGIHHVSKRCGIPMPTIYLRYANKDEMLFAAIDGVTSIPAIPTCGDSWQDLRSIVVEIAFTFFEGQGALTLGALLADEAKHPELMSMYRQRVLWPRRQMLRSVIKRGASRRE